MDSIPNWKKILLHWVNNSGLLKKNYFNLEQTDINEFFTNFSKKIDNFPQQYDDIGSFLKDQYENFELHFDDENQLSSADYMYCYSLLLHYSCVKNPNDYFHKICENLPEQHQEALSKLFSGLLEKKSINKTNLRHVIGDASPRQLVQNIPDSPIIMRTPTGFKFSPSTPKSNMLEERTKELHVLRAQLDTEKYEKSLLEIQLKQNEDQIKKLNQEQRKHISEIQELKNEILYKNGSENSSPNKRNNGDQIKKRLLKQMADKEEESQNIKQTNLMLTEQQKTLQNRLKLSEKEVSRLHQKITSMEDTVDNYSQELEQKDNEIRILLEEKNELKIFIDETRSITNGLNSSAECLDTSISRNSSSSGSINSPENLGASVIDIQLREKVIENSQLFEENEQLKFENKSLSKCVCNLLRSNSDIFEICNENLLANDAEGNNLTQIFLVFENYVKKLIKSYSDGKSIIKRLFEEQSVLNARVLELEETVNKLRSDLIELDQDKYHLESTNHSLKLNEDDLNNKIIILTKERETYLGSIKDLKLKVMTIETERNDETIKNMKQLKDITKDLLEKSNKIDELEKNNRDLSCRILELQNNLSKTVNDLEKSKEICFDLEKTKIKFEYDIQLFSKEINDLKEKFNEKQSENLVLNTAMNEKILENETLEKKVANLNEIFNESKLTHLHDLQELRHKNKNLELALTLKEDCVSDLNKTLAKRKEEKYRNEKEIEKLTNDISNIRCIKKNLEAKITTFEIEHLKSKETIEGLEVKLKENITLRDSLTIENEKLRNDCQENIDNIKQFKDELENLRIRFAAKQQDLKLFETQYNEQLIANSTFKEKFERFEDRIKEIEQQNEQLINENKRSKEINDSLKKQLAENEILLKILQDDKFTLENTQHELDETKSNCEKEILDLNKLLTERLSLIEEMKSKTNSLIDENIHHIKTIDEFNNLIKSSEKCIEDKNCVINNLEMKLKQTNNDNLHLEDQCNQLTDKLSIMVQNQDDILEKLNILTNETNGRTSNMENLFIALQEQKNQLTSQLKQLEEQNFTHKFDITEKTKQLSDLKKEKNLIQNEFRLLKESYKQKCDDLENNNNRNNFEIDSLFDEIKKNTELKNIIHLNDIPNYENLSKSIKIILNSNSELLKKISLFETEINTLTGNVDKEITEKLTVENEKLILIQEISILKKQIKDLNEYSERNLKERSNLSAENEKLKIDILRCEEDFENLRNEITKLKEKEVQFEQSNIEVTELRKKIESISKELHLKTEECSTLKDNLTNAKEYLEKGQKIIKDLTEEKSNLSSELFKLQTEYQGKINDYNALYDKFNKMELYRLQLEVDLEKTKKDLENQTNAHTEKILILETNLMKTETEISSREQNIVNLQSELNLISEKNKKLSTDLDVISEQLQKETECFNDNLKKNKEFGNKILLLEERIKDNEQKLEKYQRISSEQSTELKEIYEKFGKIEIVNSDLNKKVDRYEEESIQLNKKLEKNSIRLGEYQSKASKLEKENTQLKNQLEISKANIENLRREQTKLQTELSNFKNKFQISEDSNAELNVQKSKLEESVIEVKDQLSKALNSEMELRENYIKLQGTQKDLEYKSKQEISNLKHDNKFIEQKNVELTHEIGGLNKDIENLRKCELKLKNGISENMQKFTLEINNLKNINGNLTKDLEDATKVRNTCKNNLSETLTKLEVLQTDFDNKILEFNNLQKNYDELKTRNNLLENENSNTLKLIGELKLKEQEYKSKKMINTEMEQELKKYVAEIDNKEVKIIKLNQQVEELRVKDSKDIEELNAKLSELKEKYDKLKETYQNEIDLSGQLKKDLKIFEAKLIKNRQISAENEMKWGEEKKLLDEKIKENRFELEGKLEKMKTKMKNLYTEEVEKLKSKNNRELFDYQAKLQVLEHKKEKYEDHINKLSKQVFNLNEEIAVYQRDHKFMETKLKNYEQFKTNSIKRPQLNRTYSMIPPNNPINSNKFQMEDEEGELFNNTYLTDLKEGRFSDFGVKDSISAKELQYRNSLAPPHLRSTYLAQYKEHDMKEQDIKDGMLPVNLDDSLSSLLNADKRKKMAGTTSYKRPGPPTPSKTGGRLSFSGNNEVQSSILKDLNEDHGKKKTPSKFKLFTSRGPKDEKPQLSASSKQNIRRLSNKVKPITRHLHLGFQSSTPRKSKIHFDQKRALDQYLYLNSKKETKNSEQPLLHEVQNTDSYFETPQNSSKFKLWRQKKIVYNSTTTSDSNSPLVSDDKLRKRNNRRVSIYGRGNIYSRSIHPRKIDNHKQKAKLDRAKNFNKYRKSLHEIDLRKSILSQNFYNDTTISSSKISSITSKSNEDERISDIIGNNELTYDLNLTTTTEKSNSQKFEKLIKQIESTAPFEIDFRTTEKLKSNTFNLENTKKNLNGSNETIEFSTNGSVISMGTSTSHSKTLYHNNTINRKIPYLNKTSVNIRNSSFYIKNGNIIFRQNSKITIKDLFELRNIISLDVKMFLVMSMTVMILLLSYAISWIRS